MGLEIGGVAGIGRSDDIDGRNRFRAGQFNGLIQVPDGHSGSGELFQDGRQVVHPEVADPHLASCQGAGNEKGAGFDAVGDDLLLRIVQLFLASDVQSGGPDAPDLSAHLLQEVGQGHNLGLLGRIVDDGLALGAHRSHEGIAGGPNAADFKIDGSTHHRSFSDNIAAVQGNGSAQRLHGAQVQVHGSGAPVTASRQRYPAPAESSQKGTQHIK